MEDLEFEALRITPSTEGRRRVLGKGQSLNTTFSVEVNDENIETVLHMRWPALDHEFAVVKRILGKPDMPLREYMNLIEESQTVWSTAKPRQLLYQMSGNTGTATGRAKRRNNTTLFSVTTVCVNEFWAFTVRKRHEDSTPLLAIASVHSTDEIIWQDTELEVGNFRCGSAYFDHLYLVDGYNLTVFDASTQTIEGSVEMEPILRTYINSEAPPRISAIRVSECFVVVTVQSQGALVFIRRPGLPCIGFLGGNVSLAVPDHKEMFAVCMQTGVVQYWHVGGEGLELLETEEFFVDDVTTVDKKKITMQPEPVWNALISGPHVAVSSRRYFVMADRNPSSARLAKLDDAGTLDYFVPFADFVVTGEHAGAVLMHEYASGDVFYRSDEPKRHCDKFAGIGSQHISFAYDRIVDLLPNGNVLVITTRTDDVMRKKVPQ